MTELGIVTEVDLRKRPSRAECTCRHDRDAVGPSIGLPSRRDYDRIEQVVTDFLGEPAKVADIIVAN